MHGARARSLGRVTRIVRSLIGIAFIATAVWCSFNIRLGERTFAQHADRIGQTPEARDLMDGTRQEINPVLDEATDRLLGEHIVAPTGTTKPPPP